MKKLLLFLIAMLAIVNVSNAQRAWAYDLDMSQSGDSYTFTFKAVTAGDATLVFYKEGVEAGTLNLGSVSAGANTITKTSEELLGAIQQSGDFTWGVKMTGEEVERNTSGLTLEVTDVSRGIYHFYLPQGIVVDNNPESATFSKIFIVEAQGGKLSATQVRSERGIYVYDQTLTNLNTLNKGILPNNITLSDGTRQAMHRIAINPVNNHVAFAYNVSASPAVWSVPANNPDGEAINLIEGTAIKMPNSICFDEKGALYVMDYANATTGGTLYKVVDGTATKIAQNTLWQHNDNSLAYDGRGGIWIAQSVDDNDTWPSYEILSHINSKGEIDWKSSNYTSLFSKANGDGYSRRGQCAYSSKYQLLAFGGNDRATIYQVVYDKTTGVPTLTSKERTIFIGNKNTTDNIDGLAFDYAGDLYLMCATRERFYKYSNPTTTNTCTVPAKKAQVITLVSATPEYNVTINVNGNGTVTGANTGTYLEGTELTLTPTPAEHHEFTGWTGDVTSTDNPLTITVNSDMNITANFAKKQYTLTVLANDAAKGDVTGSGTYAYGTEVEITATAKPGYEFIGWSNGSKENPLTITMTEDTELTANFRAILASSITLNAHPVKDYSASIVGTMKRAIQNGENTIVLTHEANGTAHIYNIAHATKEVTEISQEGVNAAADGFLSISDIAVTEDGKLVACNSAQCSYDPSGTNYFYIWNDLVGNPEEWFTSQSSANYTTAIVGETMALKGTSSNAEVVALAITTGATKAVRYVRHIVNGNITTKYSKTGADTNTESLYSKVIGATYELNASPIADMNWIVDGNLVAPIEIIIKADNNTFSTINANLPEAVLGKKYNGASYLFHNDHHLMVAPYAADDKLAGVKILGITDGFANPAIVETNATLANAIDATTAAATAYVDTDGDLTIYLIADGKVYAFSEKVPAIVTYNVTATAGEGGTVEGGGIYEEGTTAVLTATPNDHYDFVSWTEGGEVVSTTAEYSFTVTKDIELTANFQEHTKYTITAVPNDENMGTVTGGDTYYVGETITLKATANSGYVFAGWDDGEKNATRTVEVSGDATYTANFQVIAPRAWAYDMKLGEEGDNYTFTFKATTAGQATITFKDKDGNALAQPASQTVAAAAGENKFTIAKNAFAAGVDAFWSITMDGEPIPAIAEITNQTRGIYDFYNMMGVVVDNNTDSKDFGKIYIQQSYQRSYATSEAKNDGITTRANEQTSGIFVYNQDLDELNDPSNVGYKPTLPNGYEEIGSSSSTFQRLNIHPKTGDLVFSHAVLGKPAVFAINRDDMTGDVTNLLTGVADMTRSVAHCFDAEGTLYVMDFAGSKGAIYKVINGEATKFTETSGRFINANITIASDGRGGFWISQNRGQIDYYYQLAHVTSAGAIDWSVYDDLGTYVAATKDDPGKLGTSSLGWLGSSSRGALAYDAERNILAQGRNGKVELYTVSYEPTITLTPLHTIASNGLGNNIDGLAFDYAGDLYVVNSSKEKFQKFTLPTAENICTVAAPALEAIRFTPVYTVSVASNNNEWGIANGGGTFEEGQNATITAVAATNYEFVNWTKEGAEVSTENPYTFAVTESATYIANFKEITKYTINVTYDNTMGTVTGVGSYYEGTEVTLTAKANGGYVFVNWGDGNTNETRTFTAGVDLPETLTANFKAAVPRAWAYDLRKGEESNNYTFTFKTTSAGTATLIFKDKDGNTLDFGAYTAIATEAGEQTITIAKTVFDAATKDIYWEVELAGEPIAKMSELTDPTKGIYDFSMPQDVKVDNSPNSMYFGQIYVAAATDGTISRGTQKRGIFVYDQALAELNTPNEGYLPADVTLANTTRNAIHRLAVNPVNGNVAFAYNVSGSSAVWSMNPANLSGNATNLIDNSITAANSICFDKDGALYVMDNANTSTGGNIYKIHNGNVEKFAAFQAGFVWANTDNSLASDGRGGLWIAQNRWQVDTYPALSHVNANGVVDFAVTSASSDELKAMFLQDDNNASYRGHCAYNASEDILAFGGNKVATLFKVIYDASGVPSLEKLMSTPKLGTNIDGVAFDYAGDLYVASEDTHRMYKFVIPTTDNTCTVPAPESQVIKKEARYTVTVVTNDDTMGTATGGGTEFLYGDEVTVTAVANPNYEFVNWTENETVVSTDAEYTFNVEGNRDLVANFQIEPLKIKGIVKRAVQIGESTVVLTHENDGTPHLYKVVNGELEAEISQEGVIARDPDNAGDYLSISDIAATEDGKLVACNYILCQNEDGNVDDGYKRGESKFYIWENLTSKPSIWFTSKMTSNWFRSKQGYTMAVKGTSQNAEIFTTGTHGTNGRTRFSWYHIIDGAFEEPAVNNNDYYHFHNGPDNIHDTSNSLEEHVGAQYELNASPLEADRWIMDGNLVKPYEYVLPATNNVVLTEGAALATDLGKKFNGATYFSMYGNHFMVAPYADTDGNLAGVRVLNITQGLDQATEATDDSESLDLLTPISATAAATAVKVNGEKLTITLVADNQLYTLATTLDLTTYTRTLTNGNFGTICLPYGSSYYTGAKFYEISWMKMRGTTPEGIYLDEVIEPLIAGKPYIFKATSNLLTVYANTDAVNEPIPGEAGLTGTFEHISTDNTILEGNYMIAQNKFWLCGAGCSLSENRAYIDAEIISQHTTEKQEIPGRRRISMGAAGENGTTGVDNLTEDATIQPNAHGTYDVLGRQLKEPTVAGFYIINGQKVIITK